MKENRQLVKGAPAGYNLMADCLDQLNYLGHKALFFWIAGKPLELIKLQRNLKR